MPIAYCLWLLAGCAQAAPPAPTLAGDLTLRAPAEIAAGAPLLVAAERGDAPDGLEATLLAQGSYGPLLYRARFSSGRAEFRIPGEDTRVAGLLTLRARAGAATGAAELRILPGPPVDPVTPLVGPRTLMADEAHWGTLAAIPFDRYGNPVAEGTPVRFRVRRPDGTLEAFDVTIAHLLAWRRLLSGRRAGHSTVTVVAGAAHGPEGGLDETPGWPVALPLGAEPRGLPADGRQLVTLRAGPIVDANGNQMLDGTLITFVAEAPDGTPRMIPAYTIDGVAEARLQAPTTPGLVTVRATLYGVASAPLRIAFTPGPAVGRITVTAEVDQDAGTVTIVAGPLLGELGQLVPEGTLVTITLAGPSGPERPIGAEAAQGYARATIQLAELGPGGYQAEVRVGAGEGRAEFRVP